MGNRGGNEKGENPGAHGGEKDSPHSFGERTGAAQSSRTEHEFVLSLGQLDVTNQWKEDVRVEKRP